MFYYQTSILILHAFYVSMCSGSVAKGGGDIDAVLQPSSLTPLIWPPQLCWCHKPSFHNLAFENPTIPLHSLRFIGTFSARRIQGVLSTFETSYVKVCNTAVNSNRTHCINVNILILHIIIIRKTLSLPSVLVPLTMKNECLPVVLMFSCCSSMKMSTQMLNAKMASRYKGSI